MPNRLLKGERREVLITCPFSSSIYRTVPLWIVLGSNGSMKAAPMPSGCCRITVAARPPTVIACPGTRGISRCSATPDADRFKIDAGTDVPSASRTSTAASAGTIRRLTRTEAACRACCLPNSMRRRTTSIGAGICPVSLIRKSQAPIETTRACIGSKPRIWQVIARSICGSRDARSLMPAAERSTVTA